MYCKYARRSKTRLLNHNGLTEMPDYVLDEEGNFVSLNPKTMEPVRGIRMALDRPSTSGFVPLADIYTNPNLANYTPFNVNNGQITYYIDQELKDPFYRPVFFMSRKVVRRPYTDPMGSEKPEYSLLHTPKQVSNFSGLSFLNDTSFHRENLMAAQQSKFNQNRITPFF